MFYETLRDQYAYSPNEQDNICPPHFHRSVEVMLVTQGEKYATINGTEYRLHAGDFLVCPPYAVHVFLPCENSKQIVRTFSPEFSKRFERFCQTRTPVSHVVRDEDGTFRRLLTELKTAKNEILFEGLVQTLFGIFVERTEFRAAKNEKKSEIRLIAEYVDEHYASPISLKTLAGQFGYSPNYFSSLFKKYFRCGIPQYVNAVRVQKSLELLKTQKISSVYFLCGFQNPQQYFLHFKKLFGCTPYEYLHGKAEKR